MKMPVLLECGGRGQSQESDGLFLRTAAGDNRVYVCNAPILSGAFRLAFPWAINLANLLRPHWQFSALPGVRAGLASDG